MKRLLALAALLPLSASAQTPPDTYTLTVTQSDIAELGRALGAMPYNDVATLITKLDGQVRAQQKKPTPAPEAPK